MSISRHLLRSCAALVLASLVAGGAKASTINHDSGLNYGGFILAEGFGVSSFGWALGDFIDDAGADGRSGKFFYNGESFDGDGNGPARGYFDDNRLLFTIGDGDRDLIDGGHAWNWMDRDSDIPLTLAGLDVPAPNPSWTISEPTSLLLLAAMFTAFLTMSGTRNRH